jgi:6,7-dimethyl-8-ribityllumazine synthase
VLIVEARFYPELADEMARGATQVLDAAQALYVRRPVPGSFELPAAIAFVLASPEAARFDGYVALGCVIEGETDHYHHICREATRGLMDLTLQHRIALGFGLLTCRTYDQARVRAAVGGLNKGADAARACLGMIRFRSDCGSP